MEIIGLIAMATSVIGFITVWIKIGHDKGRKEEIINRLEGKTEKHERDIQEIKNETKSIQIDIARNIGVIEAKLDFIKEAVNSLKGGGRNAAKK